MDDRRCFLRLKRERDTSGPDPRTIAVPVAGTGNRVMVFDLIKRSSAKVPAGATFDSVRDAAVEDDFDCLTLGVGPKRPQPRPERMTAECDSITVTKDERTIFIEARAATAATKTAPAASKRSRDAMHEEHEATWALYEARGNSLAALGERPPPRLEADADRRHRVAQLQHERLLENFVQRVDPDKLSQAAWHVLDVPLDQPWHMTGTADDLQRLVFDDDGTYGGLPDIDDDGTFAAYRRIRRYITAQAADPSQPTVIAMPKPTAVELAAYGGDDYDSNAEDNSENLYPSTDDEGRLPRRLRNRRNAGSDGAGSDDDTDDTEDFDGEDVRGENDNGATGVDVDTDEAEAEQRRRAGHVREHDDTDSWGVRSPKATDVQWGDSDDETRVARDRRELAFETRNHGDSDDDNDVAYGRPGPYERENFEEFAPDEVFYDAEGNAYW